MNDSAPLDEGGFSLGTKLNQAALSIRRLSETLEWIRDHTREGRTKEAAEFALKSGPKHAPTHSPVEAQSKGVGTIPYADLIGSPEEMAIRSYVRTILKHHQILNGVLEADLASMILAAANTPSPVEARADGVREAHPTPGPFEIMQGVPTNVLAPDGTRVARCDFDGDTSHPEAAANALLFSAASELLTAAKLAEEQTPPLDEPRDSDWLYVPMTWEAIDALRAAIGKAEGRS